MVKQIPPISALFAIIAVIWLLPALFPSKSLAFDEVTIALETQSAVHNLFVQLAKTRKQRAQGLMHRETLAPYAGMIFDFGEEQSIGMWMKNTPVPLDMIFFNTDQRVIHLHRNAVPYSLDRIDSRLPTRYVLELEAGGIDRYQIQLGDRFEWRD